VIVIQVAKKLQLDQALCSHEDNGADRTPEEHHMSLGEVLFRNEF
jgi:hypothetical protein